MEFARSAVPVPDRLGDGAAFVVPIEETHIGVAAGVRVFVREKLDVVALLRSIGASPGDVPHARWATCETASKK